MLRYNLPAEVSTVLPGYYWVRDVDTSEPPEIIHVLLLFPISEPNTLYFYRIGSDVWEKLTTLEGELQMVTPYVPIYKNPNCTINHPGSSCNE